MNTTEMWTRYTMLLIALVMAATSSLAAVTTEPNTDRPGSDYTNTNLPSADPQLCAAACENDAQCSAYTYVRPGIQGPLARCFLKSSVPTAQRNDCCVSGVKITPGTLRGTATAVPVSLSPPALAQATRQMQDAAVAQGAARQWATQAFVQPPMAGFGLVKPRYGQTISQQWLVRFSVVNPLIGELTVDLTCFDAAGQPVSVTYATVAEAKGGAFQGGPLIVAGRGARLVNLSTQAGVETWCRAASSKPFLFSASRASYERMANPNEDKIKVTESPIGAFVLMK